MPRMRGRSRPNISMRATAGPLPSANRMGGCTKSTPSTRPLAVAISRSMTGLTSAHVNGLKYASTACLTASRMGASLRPATTLMPIEIQIPPVIGAAQEDLRGDETARIEVTANGIEEEAVGTRGIGLGGIVAGYDHQGDRAGGVAGLVAGKFRIVVRDHVDARDIDARSATRDGVEIGGSHQAVAVLQIARDLLFAIGDGFGVGAAPRGDGVRNR